ncbi:MAG: TonB-dependent receptor, partial [Chitinophagales bacterium]
MKKIILVIIFFVAVFNLSAQQITIQDKETKEALPFVTISNSSDQSFAITDENGKVDISHLQNAITLEIQNLGYEILTTSYSEIIANQLIISLEKSTFSLGEITVSATRWQQEINDNTAKVSSISQQEVALQNPQTSADMLGKTGEVYIQKSQQGGGSPMIRGFAANRLLYTVDGVRMNTAIFRSGNIQNVISLDAFTMENTEVYFGASSVIYGSDAIGGVMSFQTLKPTFSTNSDIYTKGSTTIRYATANQEKTGHFDLNMGWKKWASVTSFSYNDFGDLRMGKNGADDYLNPYVVERINNRDTILSNENPLVQNPSGYTQLNIMQKLRFSPNDKWDFQYGFHFSETSEYGRYDRHILYKNELPRYGQWDYGPQKWMINNLTINHHGMNPAYDDFALRIAHQSFEESRISRDIN